MSQTSKCGRIEAVPTRRTVGCSAPWATSLATRVPLDHKIVQRLLETKDIAELYELWCYFAVASALDGLLGRPVATDRPRADDLSVSVPRAYVVQWSDGTRLSYNVSFSRTQVVGRRSYSVTLRPDITLDVRTGPNAGLHLFDAKFKLTMADTLLAPERSDTDEAEERHGTFKRGDLYKMHAYRDAIVGARSVWILYPGDETRFFPIAGDGIRSAEMLPSVVDGVGAIPLQPD
jgi:uncharacterized protein